MNSIISFIGAGNMARSIIGGLVDKGTPAQNILASAPTNQNLRALQQQFGIHTTQDNLHAAERADILVLAVKPQKMREVCEHLAPAVGANALIISIAAGIDCASLQTWLGGRGALVRCMPNTPSLVGMGATGLYAEPSVSADQKATAETLLSAVGTVAWVDREALIDAVTAVSGSGPAYFFLMLESMVAAAVAQGLPAETARALAIQTARGAAELAKISDKPLDQLRLDVTSPGGTTAQAIASFEAQGFRDIVEEAMRACAHRARELSESLGN